MTQHISKVRKFAMLNRHLRSPEGRMEVAKQPLKQVKTHNTDNLCSHDYPKHTIFTIILST